MFQLLSNKNVLKNISFHRSCKCGCLLDEKVCNNSQKWNKDKCRCECLKIKKCKIGYSWNVNNCRCEMKKLAALTKSERSLESERFLETEECDVKMDFKFLNEICFKIIKQLRGKVFSFIDEFEDHNFVFADDFTRFRFVKNDNVIADDDDDDDDDINPSRFKFKTDDNLL